MIVTVDEMKTYLRVDTDEEDTLIGELIAAAEGLCLRVLRTDDPEELQNTPDGKLAVMYATAYLYEHREEATHLDMTLSLRELLSGGRKAVF